ncbi:MAG: copper amine oxidase [Paenibacillus sp.]|nr:copper amine oxidase [Paenibacillus sp.]
MSVSTILSAGGAYASTDSSAVPTANAPIVITQAANQAIAIQVSGQALSENGFQNVGYEPMLPLRVIAEKLGYTLVWNQESLSVDLNNGPVFTTVQTGLDRYAINKMYTALGAAPVLVDNKMYVPASFISKVLHGSVVTEGNSVSITDKEQKKVQKTGAITAIHNDGKYQSIHIQGTGPDGIVLNVGEETVYQMLDGTKLSFSDLHIGLTVVAEHSIISTMSLPPQTPTYKITVLDDKLQADLLGTAGAIEEVRSSDDGHTSFLIKGTGLTEGSPSEVVLQVTDETSFIDKDGAEVDKSTIIKDTKVIGFYDPTLTKSLPPIGKAVKVLVQASE